jgi:hypothetical protein
MNAKGRNRCFFIVIHMDSVLLREEDEGESRDNSLSVKSSGFSLKEKPSSIMNSSAKGIQVKSFSFLFCCITSSSSSHSWWCFDNDVRETGDMNILSLYITSKTIQQQYRQTLTL